MWKKCERWSAQHKESIQLSLAIIAFVSIIIAAGSVYATYRALDESYEFSNKSMDLSKQALCIQKDVEYKNIAPPTIIVYLKDEPTFKDNKTASMTFRFQIIPNSKTFFYPDADEDITNFRGLLGNSGAVYYLDNGGNITDYFSGYSGNRDNSIWIVADDSFPYPPLDYRNETTIDIPYDIVADVKSSINFRLYPQKPIIVPIIFTIKIKDFYGNKYNDTVFFNINTNFGISNVNSTNQPKVFDFKIPEKYKC